MCIRDRYLVVERNKIRWQTNSSNSASETNSLRDYAHNNNNNNTCQYKVLAVFIGQDGATPGLPKGSHERASFGEGEEQLATFDCVPWRLIR